MWWLPARCDWSQGDWVPDHAPPAYTNQTCRYIQDTQNCLRNGRQDSRYLYWKWKPRGCDVLRGNARAFLQTMRGKKLAFVGDSIARNQMQSLLCILYQVCHWKVLIIRLSRIINFPCLPKPPLLERILCCHQILTSLHVQRLSLNSSVLINWIFKVRVKFGVLKQWY